MSQRTFHLSETEANALQTAYLNCRNANSKIRYQAVRLYGLGYSVPAIHEITGCSRNRLQCWVRAYKADGLPALIDARQGGNRARLTSEQIEAVHHQLHRYTPKQLLGADQYRGDGQFWTVPDLAALLAREYQVVYHSPTSLRNLLKQCDLSYQRPAKQYKSHNTLKLMDFEESLEKKSSISL